MGGIEGFGSPKSRMDRLWPTSQRKRMLDGLMRKITNTVKVKKPQVFRHAFSNPKPLDFSPRFHFGRLYGPTYAHHAFKRIVDVYKTYVCYVDI